MPPGNILGSLQGVPCSGATPTLASATRSQIITSPSSKPDDDKSESPHSAMSYSEPDVVAEDQKILEAEYVAGQGAAVRKEKGKKQQEENRRRRAVEKALKEAEERRTREAEVIVQQARQAERDAMTVSRKAGKKNAGYVPTSTPPTDGSEVEETNDAVKLNPSKASAATMKSKATSLVAAALDVGEDSACQVSEDSIEAKRARATAKRLETLKRKREAAEKEAATAVSIQEDGSMQSKPKRIRTVSEKVKIQEAEKEGKEGKKEGNGARKPARKPKPKAGR
jgi:translation initiation factor IF-2